ncbi:HAUS augmin-like complex subunit 3 [Varanus komodoensis]|uniref:HAUS augmin-like complex subunit 3 n=1 Tax=Varanus komodoensis TaxID=61221 RepID=UPI001CF7C3B1|nr:HAUS augmin-like complex subunit 3 [Varanus komodoensis]
MFSRRHSRAFLLDTVDRGTEFVEALKAVYPKAESLHEKDFDWLFDCPQAEQFLAWFCNTVGEENVLSPTELETYEKLIISEKPILEGEALEEVLKTCHQASQLTGSLQENEALPLEMLEQQVLILKSQTACQIKRCNKLQIRAAGLKQALCHSTEKNEKASRELKKVQLKLEVENFQSNEVLNQVCKMAQELLQWHQDPGYERRRVSMATADLEHCLESEDKVTKAFLGFFPKVKPVVISDMEADKVVLTKNWQGSSWEELNVETIIRLAHKVLLEHKEIVCDEDSEVQKRATELLQSPVLYEGQLASRNEPELTWMALPREMDQPNPENFRREDSYQEGAKTDAEAGQMEHTEDVCLQSNQELGRMELAYLCSQTTVVLTSAKIKGTSSTMQWAGKALAAIEKNKVEEGKNELCFHIVSCQKQLCILQSEVDEAKTQKLLPLLQGSARLLRLPIISRELDWELLRLGNLELMQEEAAGQMLDQLSHLELLSLLMMMKKKDLQQIGTKLEEMAILLNKSQSQLKEWQFGFEDSRYSIRQCPRTLIDPSDLTTLRLWKMLDKNSQEKQLFHSYETLAGRGSRLCQELRMLQVQLSTPYSQFSTLETENKVLHCMMYGDSNQLMLHAQEMSEALEQLGATQAKLYQMLMDTLSDLKSKRKSLQSHFWQTERNLYMYFFSYPDHLKELVQKVEKQTLVSSFM